MDVGELNKITERIIGIAINIHKKLGPGFTERIYEQALKYEFKHNKINFISQKVINVKYDEVKLGEQRIDFLVEDEIIVDLKSVSEINEIHQAQIISYLKTTDKKIGLILNFAKKRLEIRRLVNKL